MTPNITTHRRTTNREMVDMALEQGLDYVLSDKETFDDTCRFDQLQKCNRDKLRIILSILNTK